MAREVLLGLQIFEESRKYWLEKLSGELSNVKLPADFQEKRPHETAQKKVTLPKNITGELLRISKNNDMSLYVILLACLNILVFRITGENDVIVTSPTRGANVHQYNRFVLFRNRLDSGMTFRDLLMAVKKTVVEGYKHQSYPIGKLADQLALGSDETLFKILLLLENIHDKYARDHIPEGFENHITFAFCKEDRELTCRITYNTALFTEKTIERFFLFYVNILEKITAIIDIPLSDISLINPEEREMLMICFNNTDGDFPHDKTLHRIFEDQVAASPDRPALVAADGLIQLTYGELNRQADHFAYRLQNSGAEPGNIIAVMLETSLNIPIALLSIMKAGCAYLPIDPQYPDDRIRYMLKDSRAGLLVTTTHTVELIAAAIDIIDIKVINIEFPRKIHETNEHGSAPPRPSTDLAYIIYTSGTTGRPKGVAVEHRSVVNMLTWRKDQYQIDHQDVSLQLFSYAFDGFITAFFTPVISGARVVFLSDAYFKDIVLISDVIVKHCITLFISVPALYQAIMENLTPSDTNALKTVTLAGDKLSPQLLEMTRAKNTNLEIVNEYGITEASVMSTIFRHQEKALGIKIGHPIRNTKIYIVDKHENLLPVGIPGELCISGIGPARGYLNHPVLTNETFTPNPFSTSGTNGFYEDKRMYHTGDLARRHADGTIEFMGRIDYQVKVRGYRIELGEIENQLRKHPKINETVVLARQDRGGNEFLSAYVAVGQETTENISFSLQLKEFLSESLPDFMIPAVFTQMETIPLTSIGKIDKKALLKLEPSWQREYVAPEGPVAEKLVEILAAVLNIDKNTIGMNSDFFEMGGHSLNANIAAAKIHKAFDVKISLSKIFETSTVGGLVQFIEESARDTFFALEPSEKKEYYPLSSAQMRMYVIERMEMTGTSYNVPQIFILEGPLERKTLESAFTELVKRHESLRTSFHMMGEEPVQIIHPFQVFQVEFTQAATGEGHRLREFIRPFDLSVAPLLRVRLVRESNNSHMLMVDMHHIITDGTSMELLIREFMALYAGNSLPPLAFQYKDFAGWQNSPQQKENVKQQEAYWLEQFADEIPVLDLPLDYTRPVVQSFAGSTLKFKLDTPQVYGLNRLALETGTTLYMVLLTLYIILLHKLSGQEDIVVGTPIAGRPHADLERIIGMFINTLAMRNFPENHKTVTTFLKEVKTHTLEAFENQDYQLENLVEQVAVNRDTSRNALFDTMFALSNMKAQTEDIPDAPMTGLTVRPYKSESNTSKFDIHMSGIEIGDIVVLTFEYCIHLFKETTVQRFADYFKRIVSAVNANPRVEIGSIGVISPEEKKQILFHYNDTTSQYPDDYTIGQLFEEQAERTPHRIALVCRAQQDLLEITYRELDQRAKHLAHRLRKKGVSCDTIVALLLERGVEMMMGILAILKAGGAYLPIEPQFPEDRKQFMLADSCVRILVTTSVFADDMRFSGEIISLDSLFGVGEEPPPQSYLSALHQGSSADLAYVIYTSGTTGKPKGNLTTHYNAVRVVKNTNYIDIKENDRLLQLSNYAFDGSVFDIYGALLNGAALVLLAREDVLAIERLTNVIDKERITVFFVTTALFNTLVDLDIDCLKYTRKILFGGERVSVEHTSRALKALGPDRILHVYGPTETTVYASFYPIDTIENDAYTIPIGSALANTTLYILDKYMHLQPTGVGGELYIGGPGLARGYLNQPELTAEKFIADPFGSGGRLYRTGDLVRWLPEGNIEFLGRIDRQVKLRGFRIELGEIESRLLAHTAVKEAIVAVREENTDNRFLCAYVVWSEKALNISKLKRFLSESLPDYMVPSFFIPVEKFPLTPNGKVDLKTLTKHSIIDLKVQGEFTPPRTITEKKLLELWSEVLSVEKDHISIDAEFFRLGGHSLKATVLAAKIHKTFNVKIPLSEIFRAPTIIELAQFIDQTGKTCFADIEPAPLREYYPLSSAQKRLYILQQMGRVGTAYNMPQTIPLSHVIDTKKLIDTFQQLIRRHESLRTSFHLIDGEPAQKVHQCDHINFDLQQYNGGGDNIVEIINRFVQPFDLERAPLFRVEILNIAENTGDDAISALLLVDMHHIISDGVSHKILADDFNALFNNEELPPLRIQYKDFAQWQNNQVHNLKEQETYWLKQFEGEVPPLELPTDFNRPPIQSFEGDNFKFALSAEVTNALKSIAAANGFTLFMMLLALLNVLLSKMAVTEDIVVGTPIAGRRHTDLERIIGMFVNTLALRNHSQSNKPFISFLGHLKERTLQAFENQDYPFENLVEKVSVERDAGRNPLFDIVMTLQEVEPGQKASKKDSNESNNNPNAYKNRTAKFDITLHCMDAVEQLFFIFEYCTKLFKRETIRQFSQYFQRIAAAVGTDPGILLGSIEITSQTEKEQVLMQFNDTGRSYPADTPIHRLFSSQAQKTPDSIAVVYEDRFLTYRDLDQRANRLTAILSRKGIGPMSRVAIMADRSPAMIISVLAALKTGGAYLPLNVDYPMQRKQMILDDGRVHVLLTNRRDTDLDVPMTIDPETTDSTNTDEKLDTGSGNDLAYIMYTSGSTGIPKGVMVEHRSVVRLVKNTDFFQFQQRDRILQTGALEFDASTFEIWGALLNGSTLYLADKETILDADLLKELMISRDIATIWMTSPLFNRMLQMDATIFSTLKNLLVGGDVVSTIHVAQLRHRYPSIRIINGYGPTENTTFSTTCIIDQDYTDNIPIGKPITNSTAYIVDNNRNLQPVGIPGQLLVGGDGLARGYLNDPELTNEKFIKNPFSPVDTRWPQENERLYLTGDRARWLADGNIQFLGRIDHQIKIRGFRIELEEIEARLLRHDSVGETVVVAHQREGGDKYICAYIVPPTGSGVDYNELQRYMAQSLPDYMIPTYFIPMESIPLTVNGKVDRRALPVPQLREAEDHTQPRNAIEETLAAIWSEVLGIPIETVSIDDNFFQVGGHSLKATVLVAEIHKQLDVKVPLADIFQCPTIRKLARCIESYGKESFSPIEPAEEREYYPLVSAQKRIFVVQQMEPQSIRFNMPNVMVVEGTVIKESMEPIFRRLLQRHESLRTSFRMLGNEPVQFIVPQVDFAIEYHESGDQPEVKIVERFVRPFDLTSPPLMRVGMIKVNEKKYILMLDIHHIVGDGVSQQLFLNELMELLAGKEPSQLELQYKDFAQWQNSETQKQKMKEQEAYWLNRFMDQVPVLNMPTDFPRPTVKNFDGAHMDFVISVPLTEKLNSLLKGTETTMNMLLMAAFNILLSRYSKQEDIVVGSPITGRRHADLQNILGVFVNMLAFRNKPQGHKTFNDFLIEVKDGVLGAMENQDYQFEELVHKLGLQGNIAGNPLFSVVFAMQNMDVSTQKSPEHGKARIYPYKEYDYNISRFDLTMFAVDSGDVVKMGMEYSTELFRKSKAEKIISHFIEILEQIAADPYQKLEEITISHGLAAARSTRPKDQPDFNF